MDKIRTELLCKKAELEKKLERINDKIKDISDKISEEKKKEKKNWLDVLQSITRTEVLQKIADKCGLPITVIISIKLGVYKANENVEKNIKCVLKEMGLLC
jgi:molecular chaperone DnaK (HSP70)